MCVFNMKVFYVKNFYLFNIKSKFLFDFPCKNPQLYQLGMLSPNIHLLLKKNYDKNVEIFYVTDLQL